MSRFSIVFFMLLSPFLVFSQSKGDHKKVLQGKWVFESITAFDGNVQVPFNVDSLCCEIPTEMFIQQDDLTFSRRARADKVRFDAVISENGLCFPICGEWKIVENKLLVQWYEDLDSSGDVLKMRTVIACYTKK